MLNVPDSSCSMRLRLDAVARELRAPSAAAARALRSRAGGAWAIPDASAQDTFGPGSCAGDRAGSRAGRARRETLRAQSGKAADWIRHARALLDEAGVTHRFVATEPGRRDGRARARSRSTRTARALVIYMGGDGTFAEVAKGMLGSEHARRGRDGHAADRHRERSGKVVRARRQAPARSSATSRSIAAGARSAATSARS